MKISCSMISGVEIRNFPSLLKAGLLLQVSLLFLSGCDSSAYQQFEGRTMGSTYHITANLADGQNKEVIQQAITKRLEKIENSMSTYRPGSVISRFNQSAINSPITADQDFINVLEVSRLVYLQSNGAFDPTVGALVELWGFGSTLKLDQLKNIPDPSAIELAKSIMGFSRVERKNDLVWKTAPVQLDFSGIASGYAVDQVAEMLQVAGVNDYMVEITGEIASRGKNPRGKLWRVGIEFPSQAHGKIQAALEMDEAYITTAGDYRNYYEINGKRYSHTIDPRTGYPIKHRLSSVTVAASSAVEADAWDTALMVLGEDEGYQLAEKLGLPAYFIFRTENGFDIRYTAPMQKYLEKPAK